MTAYKTVQEFVVYRNRRFHFVSYEGQRADAARHRDEEPPSWFLMLANKRWRVMRQVPDQDRTELLALLTDWLERFVFAGAGPVVLEPPAELAKPEKRMARRGARRPLR